MTEPLLSDPSRPAATIEEMITLRLLTATGITVGVLAGIWTWVSGELDVATWVAVVAWAAFFAAGGKLAGASKTTTSTLSGVVWAWLAVQAADLFTGRPGALAVAVGLIAFLMCVQAAWSVLSFIPGAFLGAASLFGNGLDVPVTAALLVVGVLLGIASERSAGTLVDYTARRSGAKSGAVPA